MVIFYIILCMYMFVFSCTHPESLIGEHICSSYILSNMIFKYTSDMNFRNFASEADRLKVLLDTLPENCQLPSIQFFVT